MVDNRIVRGHAGIFLLACACLILAGTIQSQVSPQNGTPSSAGLPSAQQTPGLDTPPAVERIADDVERIRVDVDSIRRSDNGRDDYYPFSDSHFKDLFTLALSVLGICAAIAALIDRKLFPLIMQKLMFRIGNLPINPLLMAVRALLWNALLTMAVLVFPILTEVDPPAWLYNSCSVLWIFLFFSAISPFAAILAQGIVYGALENSPPE
jgi:hypothetical protein